MINTIIADAAPTGAQWNAWYLVTFSIVSMLGSLGCFLVLFKRDRTQIQPQPLEIRAATEFVKRAELLALTELVKALQSGREGDLAKFEASATARSSATYRKMDEVRAELTAAHESLRKEVVQGFQDIERSLGRLEGKMEGK